MASFKLATAAGAAALSVLLGGAAAAQSCVNDAPNPYYVNAGWAKLPDGRKWGAASAITVSPKGQIWVADRCGGTTCADNDLAPVMRLDASGAQAASFGGGLFVQPHGITVDRQGNIWTTDSGGATGKGQQVLKFSPDGKVLMRLGKAGVTGPGTDVFDQPTAVAFAPNGDFYVSEGHAPTNGNSRILKFNSAGKLIKVLATKGSGPDQLVGPHGLAVDSRGRLFVADKGNMRVLVFDRNGKVVESWKQFGAPQGIFIDGRDTLYVSDTSSTAANNPGCQRGIRIASARDGKVTGFIPDLTPGDAGSGAEGVAADAQGNLYGAFVATREVRRWVRK
jgi:sugar lactone lactonase YvrE